LAVWLATHGKRHTSKSAKQKTTNKKTTGEILLILINCIGCSSSSLLEQYNREEKRNGKRQAEEI
jgi:hypothetical protein